jgi:DNA-binding NtrC family response regulator
VNKLRILVLDDEPIVGKRLKPALAKSGYEVRVVATGAEALRLIDEVAFDIVVADIRMEGVDGLEVLRHARAHSPRTKVIMITGFATVELAREALTMGAFDFIAKPFKLDDLRRTILRAAQALESAPGSPSTH